jgi:hypothetical protein
VRGGCGSGSGRSEGSGGLEAAQVRGGCSSSQRDRVVGCGRKVV